MAVRPNRHPRKSSTGISVVTFLIMKNMDPQIVVASIRPRLGSSVPTDLVGEENMAKSFR